MACVYTYFLYTVRIHAKYMLNYRACWSCSLQVLHTDAIHTGTNTDNTSQSHICPRAADRNNCPQCATGCVQAICIRIVSQPGGLCGRWFLVPRAVRPILPTPTSHAQGKHQALYQHISSLRAQILLGWLTRHRKL